jgi:para-nitrobenzyl esterase
MHTFLVADPAMVAPDPQAVAQRFTELAGSAEAIEAYRRRRPGGDLRDLLADLMTDHTFLFPQLGLADRLVQAGRRVFLYQFDAAPPASPWRACHCIELPFVFGTRGAWDASMLAGLDDGMYAGISTAMMAAWVSFSRSGQPVIPDVPWPVYLPDRRMTMRFGPIIGCVGDLAGVGWRRAG